MEHWWFRGERWLPSDTRSLSSQRKQRFTEGWVEFIEKKLAKRVAYSLNGNTVGGRKRCEHEPFSSTIGMSSDFDPKCVNCT
eukprot:2834281-Amphidinium_carterae.2